MSDLQDQILKETSRRMQESVDWEILAGVCEALGWIRVEVLTSTVEESLSIKLWVKDNLNGNVKNRHDVYLFENPKDATMFTLKWK